MQIIILAAIAVVAVFIGIRLLLWNMSGASKKGDETEVSSDEDFDVEVLDQIYFLSAEQLASKVDDGKETILCLGNDTFAWNYDDGLIKALREATGAEVVNGAFPGATVTVADRGLDYDAHPEDIFSFYHVAQDIASGDFSDLEAPARARWEEDYSYQTSYENLRDMDYAALDTIVIYYDGTDYLKLRSGYNPDADKMWTDIQTVAGAYATGIRAIREKWPHIRMILVTPMLMVVYTPEGTPIAADRYDFGHGTLATYIDFTLRVGEACGVTVIDNYHGMTDEDNSQGLMVDTSHLSETGNAAVAKHIAKVLHP
ncbi:MAG: hypothetical protein K6G16_04335 [Lachnospiraceae bacterium]|nr:hypothetical protein [Lachnospiraceae bacterium]